MPATRVTLSSPVVSMTKALLVAGLETYSGAPPVTRMRPGSNMTAEPCMASASSARRPAGAYEPLPRGSIQCMLRLGPACSTRPLAVGISHMWLSLRYWPPLSAVRNGVTGTPDRARQPEAAVQTSPPLLPMPPSQEPPRVKTEPSRSSVLAW